MKGDVHHVNDIIFLFRRRIMTVAASALCAILFLISWASSSSSFPKMYISILPQLHTKFLFTEKTNLVIHREKTDIHKLLTTFKNKTNDYLCKWDVLFFSIMTTIRYEIERDLLLWFVISLLSSSWRVSQSITAFEVIIIHFWCGDCSVRWPGCRANQGQRCFHVSSPKAWN